MPIAQYTIGPPTRPNIQHDNGHLSLNKDKGRIDPSKYRKPTAADYKKRAIWLALLELGEAVQGVPLLPENYVLPDALPAYRHFHFSKGKDRIFSYERYVASDRSGKTTLASAIQDAREGAENLYNTFFNGQSHVHFQMTGSAIQCGDEENAILLYKFPEPATANWQKTIGKHYIWISGEVEVIVQNNIPQYSMVMTLHAEDRYNFNIKQADIATGIPDAENGAFEVNRMAQQYMNYGTLQRTLTWPGILLSRTTESRAQSGRDRKPSDNRRIRNRL